MEYEVLIGNTFEETAYHEAGHIVVATALGLDLKPRGIVIWAAADVDVTDGLACYCNDTPDMPTARKVLIGTRAGQLAQVRHSRHRIP
jgi:hypothetical protein